MMQENTTILKHRPLSKRGFRAARVLLATAAFVGCEGQTPSQSSTATTPDSAAAYLALSSMLDSCEDTLQTCLMDAGDDPAARAQCQATADACSAQTGAMEQQAEQTLEREAHHCRKLCSSDEDAGAQDDNDDSDDGDAGSGDMHACLSRHAPKLPKCVSELFTCMEEAGIRERDATRSEIRACLREAHSCFKQELAERRAERRMRHSGHGSDSSAMPAASEDDSSGDDSTANDMMEAQGATAGAAAPSTAEKPKRGLLPFWKR